MENNKYILITQILTSLFLAFLVTYNSVLKLIGTIYFIEALTIKKLGLEKMILLAEHNFECFLRKA